MCESSNPVGKGRSKEITLDIKCKMTMIMMTRMMEMMLMKMVIMIMKIIFMMVIMKIREIMVMFRHACV